MTVTKTVTVTFDKHETEILSKIMELTRQQIKDHSAGCLGFTENEYRQVYHLVNEFFIQVY